MTTLYGYVSNQGEPLYDDILQSDLPTDEKVKQIKMRGQAYRDAEDAKLRNDLAKQYAGAALEIGSAAIPVGAGLRLTGSIAKGLTPYIGRKIAQEVGSGIVSGGLSGGVFGMGRGLMEDENPLLTAIQDSATGMAFGGLGGYAGGLISKNLAKRNLLNNPDAQINYFDDYLNGLSNNAFKREGLSIQDARGLQTGNYGLGNEGLEYLFAGENALTADKETLEQAKNMFTNGVDNESIRQKTGWFKGVDGKWRFEIPDGKIKEPLNYKENLQYFDWGDGDEYYSGLLPKIYDAPELYTAYPELKQTVFQIKDLPFNTVAQTGSDMGVTANKKYFGLPSTDETINHEVQHQIQMIEDFARGGNLNENDYNNLAGEVESRLVEQRHSLFPEQRLEQSPLTQYDIDPEKQIVKFDYNDSNLYSSSLDDKEFDYEKVIKEANRLKAPKPIAENLKREGEIVIMKGSEPFEKGEIDRTITELTKHMSPEEMQKGVVTREYNGYKYQLQYDKNGKHTMGKYKTNERLYNENR